MAVAIMYPEGQKRGPKEANLPAKQAKLSRDFLTKARTVLRHSEPLAREILAGSGRIKLSEAYDQEPTGHSCRDGLSRRAKARP